MTVPVDDKGVPEAASAEVAGSESQPTAEELQAQLAEAQNTIKNLRRFEKKYKVLAEKAEAADEPPVAAPPEGDASEAAQLKAKLMQAQAQVKALAQQRTDALLRAAVIAEASKLGFEYPEDVWRTVNRADLEIDDETGEVTGADEAVKAVAKTRPRWLRSGNVGVGQAGGGRQETDDEKRSRLFGSGGGGDSFWRGAGVIMNKSE